MKRYYGFFLLFFTVLFMGCEYNTFTRYDLGDNFIDDPTNVMVIDTFTVQTFTIATDSMATSRNMTILSGKVKDLMGVTTYCESYFRLVPPTNTPTFHTSAELDSACIILYLDTYREGDTTQTASFEISMLSEEMELYTDANYFYNNRKFKTEDTPLGTFSIDISKKTDSVIVKLPADKAELLYGLALRKSDTITKTETFLDAFKGFAIKPVGNTPSFVTSFRIHPDSATAPSMRVYYHDITDNDNLYFTCSLERTTYVDASSGSETVTNIYASTYIKNDYTGTVFENLKTGKNRLPSISTNNMTMIQAGSNITTGVLIPGIDDLYGILGIGSVVKAELIFEPIQGSFNDFYDLPQSLEMFLIDEKNEVQGKLPKVDASKSVYAILNYDKEFKNEAYYSFDITRFVKDEYDSKAVTNYALSLSIPTQPISYTTGNVLRSQKSLLNTGVDRLYIGNAYNTKNKMKLRIYMSLIN